MRKPTSRATLFLYTLFMFNRNIYMDMLLMFKRNMHVTKIGASLSPRLSHKLYRSNSMLLQASIYS